MPSIRPFSLLFLSLLAIATQLPAAGYKIIPWKPREISSYPATLTSEGVTIAVEPLLTNATAARAFNRPDIVTRGIMPLAVVIFNSNAFPIQVDGMTVELQWEGEKVHTMDPLDVVRRLYEGKSSSPILKSPIPIPRATIQKSHADACQDFKDKFLGVKEVYPQETAGGFLFLNVAGISDLPNSMEKASVYLPDVFGKQGKTMLFFEIELKPAVASSPRK
jgi:hypothetical protein